jgi:hypothetical protein
MQNTVKNYNIVMKPTGKKIKIKIIFNKTLLEVKTVIVQLGESQPR